MRLLLTLGFLLATGPLAAQSSPLPGPHPAAIVWSSGAAPLTYPNDTVRATTGAGAGTWIGAGIGGVAGYMVASLCGIGEGSCGNTQLIGFALGAFTGAMIGSALEGPQPSGTRP